MFTGFYTAASGMLMNQRNLNLTANNISNINTPGFRVDRLISQTFQKTLTRVENGKQTDIGTSAQMRLVSEVPTQFDPSALYDTYRPFDMAINGEGFFNIEGEAQTYYTRNGNFDIDEEGFLVLRGVGRVLGENGPIELGTSNFTMLDDGSIVDPEDPTHTIDRIMISRPPYDQIEKFTNGLYIAKSNANVDPETGEAVTPDFPLGVSDGGTVLHGVLERSNIDMTREMTLAMEAQRSFQACSNALKIIDQLNSKSANQIASL